MSVHGLIRVAELFPVLIADTSFTRGYVHQCHHLVVPLDLWAGLQSFFFFFFNTGSEESSSSNFISPYVPLPSSAGVGNFA